MCQNKPEVIRVGASGARIVRVSQKRIEYVDMAGQEQFIDLEECARNWTRWYDDHSQEFLPAPGCVGSQAETDAWNAHCVGRRGGAHPLWWVEFMDKQMTRFEFGTWEGLWRELQGPLMLAGWHTFDTE